MPHKIYRSNDDSLICPFDQKPPRNFPVKIYAIAWHLQPVWLALVFALAICHPGICRAATHNTPANLVTAASEYAYPPFCIVTQDNQADGFSVELLRAALKAMHKDVVFKVGPWGEIKQDLADGRIQVLPLVGRTPEREEDYDFTFPYLTMHGTILVRGEDASIRSLEDLHGKQVAVMAGDNAEEFLHRTNLGATIVPTPSFEQAIRELAAGKHDAVIIQKLLALQLMKQLDVTTLKTVGPPLTEFVQSFCFAVRKGDHSLLRLLNEGLSIVIADDTYNNLRIKWFAPIEEVERKKSRIVVGGDNNYPPYEFLDENGQPAGYNVDLTRAIAKQMGIAVEIRLGPWGEIRKGLEANDIDIIQSMFYSKERDTTYSFSPAHAVVNHAIVVRSGDALPASLADLSGKTIIVMDGDIMHDTAVKHGYGKQLVLVKSQEEALRQLANGNYDCALVAKIPAHYWINKHRWKNLKVADQSILSPEYCYAAPRDKEGILPLFSEGLANIKSSGQYRDIYSKWLGVYEKPSVGWRDVLKYSLLTTIPIIIMLIGSILWSRTLRRQVTLRTAELQAEIEQRQQKEVEIEAKNAELERFTYTASHDLKSPLVTMKAFLGFFEKDLATGNTERIKSDMHYMHTAVNKMNTLLSDLLEISRIGLAASTPELVSFEDVAHEALVLVTGAMNDAAATVTIAGEPVMLYGDRTRLVEIWQNLIDNAIKYRSPERASTIEVGLDISAEGPVFFVRDNGMGIDPCFHDKIFGLFNQLNPDVEGSGLGLALVKRIVEFHQGNVWVESEVAGHGACFRFTLPGAIKMQDAGN
jgi:ABC-type amino acid transport substrate-binding protein/signal transduction histidine kinase